MELEVGFAFEPLNKRLFLTGLEMLKALEEHHCHLLDEWCDLPSPTHLSSTVSLSIGLVTELNTPSWVHSLCLW